MEFLLHKIGVVIVMFKFVTNFFLSFIFMNSNILFFMIFQFSHADNSGGVSVCDNS